MGARERVPEAEGASVSEGVGGESSEGETGAGGESERTREEGAGEGGAAAAEGQETGGGSELMELVRARAVVVRAFREVLARSVEGVGCGGGGMGGCRLYCGDDMGMRVLGVVDVGWGVEGGGWRVCGHLI